jgi:tRNA(fMet)-specific endonuclease VapC
VRLFITFVSLSFSVTRFNFHEEDSPVGFLMGRNEKRNRAILKDFLSFPRVIIAEIGEETSERYAAIAKSLWMQGTPIPTNDLWIAASAMQHGLKVFTNDKHYLEIPKVITEYFDAG